MYLNVYQPQLQRDLGVVSFFRFHRGQPFAASSLMATMTVASEPPIDLEDTLTFSSTLNHRDQAAHFR